MALEDRQYLSIRLPTPLMKRFTKAADERGQTKQAFILELIRDAAADADEQRQTKKTIGRNTKQDPAKPAGLGLTSIQPPPVVEEPATPVQQTVINVGGGTPASIASGGDAIERLASFVAAGPQFERDHRMRTAVSVLRASASTDEERKVLADKLDVAVAAKTQTQAQAGDLGVVRAARATFDKIVNLFGKDDA